jgi:methyl-accepting chemotaxis protein
MRKYKDMKISAKLIMGFIIVAMIAGIVGITGVYFTKTLNKASTQLYTDNTMGVSIIGKADVSYQKIRFNMIKILLDTSTADEGLKKVEQSEQDVIDNMKQYESTMFTSEDKENFAELSKNWDVYNQNIDKIKDDLKNGKIDDAKSLAFGDGAKAGDNLEASFEKLTKFKTDAANAKADSNDQLAQKALYIMIITIVVGIIIAVALGIVISRIISVPVNRMKDAANQLALGDVNVDIDVHTKDEIGSLADSMKEMIANTRAQAQAAERIADGDLTVNIAVRSDKDLLGKMMSDLVDRNNEVLSNIANASDQVAAGSKQVSDSSIALSQGATEQASSIEELTASLEEISSQTKLNAQNASQANELAEVAKSTAVQGNSQMKEMQNAMDEINVSSSNISKIIKVIDEIAFQTNILALNAAVEAARAGQHGKGFAVVAEEVRTLAARSANAAKETTDMIEGSITKVEAGTKIANDTAEALNKIVEDVAKAARLVADIATASNEQATGIAQINQGIMQVSQVVQTNSATAEESAAASEELSSQAELLKESVSKYRLKADNRASSKFDELNPEVIKMLENMADKEKPVRSAPSKRAPGNSTPEPGNGKTKIVLSDSEFGKY